LALTLKSAAKEEFLELMRQAYVVAASSSPTGIHSSDIVVSEYKDGMA